MNQKSISSLEETDMGGGKLQKVFYFFGILLAIVGIVALVVFLVVYLKSKDSDSDDAKGEHSK